jgi:protein-ribulosamine 3-kinase
MGIWRPVRYKLGRPYMEAYHKFFPISALEEDHDNRNALYAIRADLYTSALYPGNTHYRLM